MMMPRAARAMCVVCVCGIYKYTSGDRLMRFTLSLSSQHRVCEGTCGDNNGNNALFWFANAYFRGGNNGGWALQCVSRIEYVNAMCAFSIRILACVCVLKSSVRMGERVCDVRSLFFV